MPHTVEFPTPNMTPTKNKRTKKPAATQTAKKKTSTKAYLLIATCAILAVLFLFTNFCLEIQQKAIDKARQKTVLVREELDEIMYHQMKTLENYETENNEVGVAVTNIQLIQNRQLDNQLLTLDVLELILSYLISIIQAILLSGSMFFGFIIVKKAKEMEA